jgi:hypothetical protein
VIELADGVRITRQIAEVMGLSVLYVAKWIKHVPGYGKGRGITGGGAVDTQEQVA